ncbi:MAG: AAA family ATPase [bacterium]|nr:AAA family ATPase [bacterium]
MYKEYFALKENPFNLTPDSHFLFPSKKHQEALAHLTYGIEARKGFILITGEVGAGKTTLCRALLSRVEKNIEVAFVLNSYLNAFEILQAINEDFGIKTTAQ